ncbi:MAG: hypothetical protein QM489_06015 [Candidatus Izemoplasma sp.]
MKNLKESFESLESLFAKVLGGAFLLNALLLALLFILQGEVPIGLAFVSLFLGLYHLVFFFVYIYRVIVYYQAENNKQYRITYSIVGIVVSPIGLLFSFFNYMIIVLSNVW